MGSYLKELLAQVSLSYTVSADTGAGNAQLSADKRRGGGAGLSRALSRDGAKLYVWAESRTARPGLTTKVQVSTDTSKICGSEPQSQLSTDKRAER